MSGATLTLVVCTYRRPRPVRDLLTALQRQTEVPDEVIVADASPDEETRLAAEDAGAWLGPRLRYVHVPPEHRGLTRQRNYAVARCDSEVVAFLDDDTIPAPDYFAELLDCFRRHPEAAGVGGYVDNEVKWTRVAGAVPLRLSEYRSSDWSRREDFRWRLRKLARLDAPAPPGHMPRSGHGRPTGFVPPDGADHPAEFLIGCAFAFRRDVFRRYRFSRYFEGYGLYEDLDFCVRALEAGPLYVCTCPLQTPS